MSRPDKQRLRSSSYLCWQISLSHSQHPSQSDATLTAVCPVAAVRDEATELQVSINTNTFCQLTHQTEVRGADQSHQKSQRIEQVEPLQPSRDEDLQCCCCSGRRAHLHLSSGELCCSTHWSKKLTCTCVIFLLALSVLSKWSIVALSVNGRDSLTGGRSGAASEQWQCSCCIWRDVSGLLEGLFNSLNELRQTHWAHSHWSGCVFTNERCCCWWTPSSCLLSFTQMPYTNRHKRSAAGCRVCCGCCPGMRGCGLCCKFWGFLHHPGISTTSTICLFVMF